MCLSYVLLRLSTLVQALQRPDAGHQTTSQAQAATFGLQTHPLTQPTHLSHTHAQTERAAHQTERQRQAQGTKQRLDPTRLITGLR